MVGKLRLPRTQLLEAPYIVIQQRQADQNDGLCCSPLMICPPMPQNGMHLFLIHELTCGVAICCFSHAQTGAPGSEVADLFIRLINHRQQTTTRTLLGHPIPGQVKAHEQEGK